MGGKNYNIQIDELLFRGKRKYNRGRLKPGDKKPKESIVDKLKTFMENNIEIFGTRITGPWGFQDSFTK